MQGPILYCPSWKNSSFFLEEKKKERKKSVPIIKTTTVKVTVPTFNRIEYGYTRQVSGNQTIDTYT